MGVVKTLRGKGGRKDDAEGRKEITIRTKLSSTASKGSGSSGHVIISNGSIANVRDKDGASKTEVMDADNKPNKVTKLRFEYDTPSNANIGGSSSGVLLTFCENSAGDNPVVFWVFGGKKSMTKVDLPCPFTSPYDELHIRAEGYGPLSLAGGKGGGYNEALTFDATVDVTLSK